ncbi:MAG: pseudouridine synthase [Emcibacter sp.]|nr:pseudouridine synthase [Emcibacter sp.]
MTDDKKRPSEPSKEPTTLTNRGERIAKMLARAGVGSRRAVERMIEAGMVKQDGQVITTPATLITSVTGITVDGMVVQPPEPTKIWKYHKPAGRMTTYYDPEGRPTVFEAMPTNMPRVLSVGRLDLNTEGLLLMTNDGELARWLELPSTGWIRTYKVRCHGYFDREKVAEIRRGITIEDVKYRGVRININENRDQSNIWLTIAITEGKNREVRKLLEYIGLQVTRLIRLSYGPFELGSMARGDLEEITPKDMLLHCADFFKDKGTSANLPETEETKTRTAKQRAGWAKAKPKPNQRPVNKKKNAPRRHEDADKRTEGPKRRREAPKRHEDTERRTEGAKKRTEAPRRRGEASKGRSEAPKRPQRNPKKPGRK